MPTVKPPAPKFRSTRTVVHRPHVAYVRFKRSSKGAHLFVVCDETGTPINTWDREARFLLSGLYLRKNVIGEQPPVGYKITIEPIEER